MKVKLKTCRAGVGFVQNIGDVIDVDDAEGQRMIEAGQAVTVEVESAAEDPGVENAAANPTPKPKRKRSTKKPAETSPKEASNEEK